MIVNKLTFPIFFLFLNIISTTSFSQTTYVIDYTALVRDNNQCTAFLNPVVIGGYPHQAILGNPIKGAVFSYSCFGDGFITLPSDGGTTAGYIEPSGYRIPFNFKKYYKYNISVLAKSITNGRSGTSNLGVQMSSTAPPPFSACGAGVLNSIRVPYSEVKITPFGVCLSSDPDWAWFTALSTTATENRNNLLVAAFPDGPLLYGSSILIKNLKIVETPPTFTIVGTNQFCQGQSSFSLSNIGPDCITTGITWSISPNNNAVNFVSPVNNPSCTLNVVGNGVITLKAVFSNSCISSGIITVLKVISVGLIIPSITSKLSSGPGEPTDWQFTATPLLNGVTYNWYVGNTLDQGGTSNVFNYYYPCNVSKTVKCSISNACGLSPFSNSITKTGECTRAGRLALSPNPATNTVAVSLIPIPSSQSKSIIETFNIVRIYDQQGNIKKYQKGNKISQIIINVDNLNKGVYIVEITDGYYKERQKLIIQK